MKMNLHFAFRGAKSNRVKPNRLITLPVLAGMILPFTSPTYVQAAPFLTGYQELGLPGLGGREQNSMGPTGLYCVNYTFGGRRVLRVTTVLEGSPAAAAGFKVEDRIVGTFGGKFHDEHRGGWTGPYQEFAAAIDRAEGGDGKLPVSVLRSGVGSVETTLQLVPGRTFSPGYPLGSAKCQDLYESAVTRAARSVTPTTNSIFYTTNYMAMILLSSPHWNDTTGDKPYGLSLQNYRDKVVRVINNSPLEPKENFLPGTPKVKNPDWEVCPRNWHLIPAMMFLAEYRLKSGDASLDPAVQRAADMLANNVIDWKNRLQDGEKYPRRGVMTDTGVVGSYGEKGFNTINSMALVAFSMLKEAGADVNDVKFQKCMIEVFRSEKNQTGAIGYRRGGADSNRPGFRRAGFVTGGLLYGRDTIPDANDRIAFERIRIASIKNWIEMQRAYNFPTGAFTQTYMSFPLFGNRERAFLMDNHRVLLQGSREHGGTIAYFGNDAYNQGDTTVGTTNVAPINAGVAMAIGLGKFQCFPARPVDQIYADFFKTPHMIWPELDARLLETDKLTQPIGCEITNYKGDVLSTSSYTAQWTNISGPGTPTFTDATKAATTITFPKDGDYMVQLEVTKGSTVLTEPIRIIVDSQKLAGYTKGLVNLRVYEKGQYLQVDREKPTVGYSVSPRRLEVSASTPYHGAGMKGPSLVTGVLIPPTTGDYSFAANAPSAKNKRMQINVNGTDPSGSLTLVRNNGSVYPTRLEAGVPVYYEVETSSKPGITLRWKTPGASDYTTIPKGYFYVKNETKLIHHPDEVSVNLGDVAVFPMSVEGPGPFVSEWFKNGQSAGYSKGEAPELEIGNLSSAKLGYYNCVITYPGGVLRSETIDLKTPTAFKSGGSWANVYPGIRPSTINELRFATPSFPNTPTISKFVRGLNYNGNISNRIGILSTAWLTPTETSDYIFSATARGEGELWLSTNDSPSRKVKVASTDAESVAISLEAGKRYYIEFIYRNRDSRGTYSVKWRKSTEAASAATLIPAAQLEALVGGVKEYSPVRKLENVTAPKVAQISVGDVNTTTWKQVPLDAGFTSPVIVATPIARDANSVPVVTRLRNVTANSFEIKIDRTDGQSGNVSVSVSVVVVEEGVYTLADNGVKMEAVKYDSSRTDNKTSWVGTAKTYQNSYTKPIVLGQVMTTNDADWSVFWSCGSSPTNPPSATALKVGKHVGEDSDKTRSNETVGYIVIDAGSGIIAGEYDVFYTADRGTDTVYGVSSSGYNYPISALPRIGAVALSAAGMDGGDGGWPVLFGTSPMLQDTLKLFFNEDKMADSERAHTSEEVAYLAFSGVLKGNRAPVSNGGNYQVTRNTSVTVNLNSIVATDYDPEGDALSLVGRGNPANGTVSGTNSNLVYTPNADFVGLDAIPYTIADAFGNATQGKVFITVLPEISIIETGNATSIKKTNARLYYNLVDNGGGKTRVTIHFGTSNGGQDASAWDDRLQFGVKSIGSLWGKAKALTAGTTYYYVTSASNKGGVAWGEVKSFQTPSNPLNLVKTKVSNVSSASWTQVDLGYAYINPVVIATPYLPNSSAPPVSVRVRNATGSSVELRLNRLDGASDPVTMDVSLVAVEQGTYTVANNGVKMEAVKFTSTVTAKKGSWIAEARTYQNTYTNPIVIGQVMSANDAAWSEFWCKGATQTSPPSASEFSVGKHVASDPNATRVDETIGYIVIEAGSGQISGIDYIAGLGNDTVLGTGDTSTGYGYSITGLSTVSAAALSQAGMDGGDGSWALLYGATPLTSTTLTIAVDEDKLGDSERKHTTEQVSYILFK